MRLESIKSSTWYVKIIIFFCWFFCSEGTGRYYLCSKHGRGWLAPKKNLSLFWSIVIVIILIQFLLRCKPVIEKSIWPFICQTALHVTAQYHFWEKSLYHFRDGHVVTNIYSTLLMAMSSSVHTMKLEFKG